MLASDVRVQLSVWDIHWAVSNKAEGKAASAGP
jgi:hypothetical protein